MKKRFLLSTSTSNYLIMDVFQSANSFFNKEIPPELIHEKN